MQQPKDATEATRLFNEAFAKSLPHDTRQDFEDAGRGFIGTIENARVEASGGRVVWDMAPYAFEADELPAPATVNPSLWRQAQLNTRHGLFEVTPGIYQVRGFDISNVTFIEGKSGYIVVDPLTSAEPAAAALALMRKHRGDKPVTAVIYTHSHVDHYGGVRGVLSDDDIRRGLRIIAPEGFLQAAISENILAGNAMGRRATYMFGSLLPRGPRGHVDSGLGKATSQGAVSLVPPTESITQTGTRHTIDGVDIVYQLTPDTEAPAEMNFYFPQFKALCMAENCTCHLHNLYTPRGAQVRDAKGWSRYIGEAVSLFASDADVEFASHHWPRWGSARIVEFLTKQRDLYKFIHDQTLRFANHGLTPVEIGETLRLPPQLAAEWHTRSYYGTLNHNAKAVYQRYLGWFDGNPARLYPHPPVEAGQRYVALAGGADALLATARQAFEKGDYRWVAELVNHLVFADPDNVAARELQADALEQLGYQSESGPWRAIFLTGAQELRASPQSGRRRGPAGAQLRALPADELLDALSVRLNGAKAGGRDFAFGLQFEGTTERWRVSVENAVLHHELDARGSTAPLVHLGRDMLIDLAVGETSLDEAAVGGRVRIDGDRQPFADFLAMLDRFEFFFAIIEPGEEVS
ncbi:alkyl sulfatase dimerization domain-containing protein [Bradyrhizobium sp. LHD-71]|uniref:alkyl/aryl-sulfatase n=1 Tax=Bradyrhizobium sp. LHD-71 TaxID=3072141 RepID=UPI00280DEE0B|nr:alkyl sulfatase dimerization domain-containing protein [Bradyrhizobium sp. LHD-71]MDQ8732684.1 alkyl sulfatase dimerization domain-containing protein [Bradyrhizobium sp. LHD-71]